MSRKEDGASRRDFLKLAGTTGPLAVAAVMTNGERRASSRTRPIVGQDAGHPAHPRLPWKAQSSDTEP